MRKNRKRLHNNAYYFASGKGAKYCDEYVSVSLSVHSQLENHMAELRQIFVYDAFGPGSVLLWWHCDTLCTSVFVDNIMFSHNDPLAHHVYC